VSLVHVRRFGSENLVMSFLSTAVRVVRVNIDDDDDDSEHEDDGVTTMILLCASFTLAAASNEKKIIFAMTKFSVL